jgi:heme oxygenase (biliverdin-IX-beta and delta-forming)
MMDLLSINEITDLDRGPDKQARPESTATCGRWGRIGPCLEGVALHTDRLSRRCSSAAVPTLAECLRNVTGRHHASIERTLPLASFGLAVDVYRRILGAFLGFYEPLEAGLIRVVVDCGDLDLRGREKGSRLRHDLRMLGLSEAGLAAIPRCPTVPHVDGVPGALGCMYVLEGSTLGGQIIHRHLEERLAIDAHSGGTFFHGYGAETGAMWRSFVARLNRQPPPFERVVAAAVETFEQFERWLIAQGAPTWRPPAVPA